MKKLTLIAVAAASIYSASAIAGPEEGASELGVYGNFSTSSDYTFVNANFTYGKFMSSKLLWNFGLGIFGIDTDAGDSTSANALTGVTYHLNDTGSTSYFKGNVNILDLENAGDTSSIEGFWGYKNYLNERTALFYEVGYRAYLESNFRDDEVVGNIGITFLFN